MRNFEQLFDAAPLPAWVFDPESLRILSVNDAAIRTYGWTREEFTAMSLAGLRTDADADGIRARLRASPGGYVREAEHRRKDGSRLDVYITVRRIEMDGRVSALTFASDITERKRAERALRESLRGFRVLFETAPLPMWVVTPRLGRVVAVNDASLLQYGYERREVLAMSESALATELEREAFRGIMKMTEHPQGSVWTHVRKGGSTLRAEVFHAAIEFEGEPSILIIAADVTERERMIAARLLAAQEEERRRVAHDLHDGVCQQLALIALEIDAVRRAGILAPDFDQRLQAVRERAHAAGREVRAMSYSLHPTVLEDLGLAVAVQSLCDEFGQRTAASIEFVERDIPPEIPLSLGGCFYRVAQEALRNAEKHSGARRVRVDLRGEDGQIRLAVRDWGAGFDPDRAGRGLGLGLAGMHERVRLVRGQLTVWSKPGEGAEIIVKAPIQ